MRTLRKLLAAVCFIMALACTAAASAAETKIPNYDIMLVVDDTGSMRRNDPNSIASVALQRFADSIPMEGSRIGMATYSEGILSALPMIEIKDQSGKETLKEYAQTGLTRGGAYTDLSTALEYAVSQLRNQPKSDSFQAIIAVSDGENTYANDTARRRSEENLAKVMEVNIPVYLILISAEDSSSVRDYMDNIATGTGGKLFQVDSGDAIDGVLSEIKSDIYNDVTSPDTIITVVHDEPVEWPFRLADNIFEANVKLTYSDKSLSMQLKDANGREIPMDESNGIIVSHVEDYSGIQTNIKLLEPAAGDYTLVLTSQDAPQTVMGEVIWNYEIYVDVEMSPSQVTEGELVTVTARLMRGDEPYKDLSFTNLTAALTLDGQAFDGGDGKMDWNDADGYFQCSFSAPSPSDASLTQEDHEVVVTVRGTSTFHRSSAAQLLTVVTAVPSTPARPLPVTPAGPVNPDPSASASQPVSGLVNPLWIVLGVAALLALVLIFVLLARKLGKKTSGTEYIQLQGTLIVTYYQPGHSFTWEKYVQPGSYYSKRNPRESLGKMLRDQQDFGNVPPYFDTVMVGGVRHADGQQFVEISARLGTPEEPQQFVQTLSVDNGMQQEDIDAFGEPPCVTLHFEDNSEAEITYT